jgi:transcription antitermination protein NusB
VALPRDIRRAAFQALYQLDARGVEGEGEDLESVRRSMEDVEGLSAGERGRALELALAAYGAKAEADAQMLELAPDWPAYRQAAVDRAILRLAHFEMCSGRTPPKAAVNEAVELAKAFGTDRSPGFINALPDKVLKRLE